MSSRRCLFTSLDRTSAGVGGGAAVSHRRRCWAWCARCLLLLLGNRLVRRGFAAYQARSRWIDRGDAAVRADRLFRAAAVHECAAHRRAGSGNAISRIRPMRRSFGMLHGVSSAFYVVESLLGVVLVWRLPGAWFVVGARSWRGVSPLRWRRAACADDVAALEASPGAMSFPGAAARTCTIRLFRRLMLALRAGLTLLRALDVAARRDAFVAAHHDSFCFFGLRDRARRE